MEYGVYTGKRDAEGNLKTDKDIGKLELPTVPALGKDIKVGNRKYKVKCLNILNNGYRQIIVEK